MDLTRFDAITRTLASGPDRRRFARGLAGMLVLAAGQPAHAQAKKKKQKKPKFNAFGCLDIGQKCRGSNSRCCSGICEGKKPKRGMKDKSVCVAHNVGGCTPLRSVCLTEDLEESSCDPETTLALCFATTGKAGFCADREEASQAINCQICARDTDCEALGFPPGSACVLATGAPGCDADNDCAGVNGSSGTACFPPAA